MHCLECEAKCPKEAGTCAECGRPLPHDADSYFKAGMDALSSGDISRSVDLLMDCVALNPDHLSGQYNLGIALSLAGMHDEAVAVHTAISERDPRYPGVSTALGQAHFGSLMALLQDVDAKRDLVVGLFLRAIEEDSEDIDAHFSLAAVYIATGKADKALPHLKRAMDLQPNSAAIHFAAARAFKMLGRKADAATMATVAMQFASPADPFWSDIEQLLMDVAISSM